MTPPRTRIFSGMALLSLLLGTVVAAACGARSQLKVGPGEQGGAREHDAGFEDVVDAPPDVPPDVPEDVPFDVPFDVPPDDCIDPDVTYIYVVTAEDELWAYKPALNVFQSRGVLNCPSGSATPFSMAVARNGLAYVVYNDGNLFLSNVFDADCIATPFEVGQHGFMQFGMGFGADPNGGDDSLYVAEISFNEPSQGLARIDTETFELEFIGPFSQNPGYAIELTPTGMGPLYGYFLNQPGPGGTLVQIDTDTATITESTPLSVGPNSSALAVSWWGGSFYIFTTNLSGSTDVTRYDPVTKAITPVQTFGQTVVGAGVSTCAPQQADGAN